MCLYIYVIELEFKIINHREKSILKNNIIKYALQS